MVSGTFEERSSDFAGAACVALLLLQSFCFACNANPVGQEESGLTGQVLRGPVVPGPGIEGSPDETPFAAFFHVLDGRDDEVAQFRSDENGRFRIALRPGNYTVVPDDTAPLLFPSRQERSVTVPEKGFAEVVLSFDTGIR